MSVRTGDAQAEKPVAVFGSAISIHCISLGDVENDAGAIHSSA